MSLFMTKWTMLIVFYYNLTKLHENICCREQLISKEQKCAYSNNDPQALLYHVQYHSQNLQFSSYQGRQLIFLLLTLLDFAMQGFFPKKQILCHRRNFITNDPLFFILCVHMDAISRKMYRLMKSCGLFINHGFWKMY